MTKRCYGGNTPPLERPWGDGDWLALSWFVQDGLSAEEIAAEVRRPPEVIRRKLAELPAWLKQQEATRVITRRTAAVDRAYRGRPISLDDEESDAR